MFLFLAPVSVDTRELRVLIDIICEAAGLSSIEKFSAVVDVDRTQLQRQMDGDGHVSLSRIVTRLGSARFYGRLGWLLLLKYGPPVEARRAAWAYLGYFGDYHKKRMQLRMELRKKETQKTAAPVPQKQSA
jgi:hypothetical protein